VKKRYRRAFAVAVVAITAGIAWAAGGAFDLAISPTIIGVRHLQNSGGSGFVAISAGAGGFSGNIVYNCGTPMKLANGDGDDPLTIAANGTTMVSVECPATLPAGMHRCTFEIRSGDAPAGAFLGFCETFTQGVLTASPVPIDPFINQQVGFESQPQTVSITNTSLTNISSLSLQVDNPNFLVGSPCGQNVLGCDDGVGIQAGSNAVVSVLCHPQSSGLHTGKLFIVGDNGFSLMDGPLQLSCSTGGMANVPVLTLDPPNIDIPRQVEVNNDSENATLTLSNGGTSGSLTIEQISITDEGVVGASSDWSFTLDGACMTLPCPLAAMDALNMRLTFDPSGFGARPARVIIGYTDAMGVKQESTSLTGSGIGATLELVTTTAINFGVVALNTQADQQIFQLLNQGNRTTTANLAATPMTPFVFPMQVAVPPGVTDVFVGCFSTTAVEAEVSMTIEGIDATATQALTLRCEVRDTPLVADPASLPLGEVRTLTIEPPEVVTVDRVTVGTPIMLSSAALSQADPNLSLGGLSSTVTPATTTLSITPTTEGAIDTSIVITPAAGGSIDVPVSGTVVRAELTADPPTSTSKSLGTFCVGQPTTKTSVTLTSTGTATILVNDVSLAAGTASPFLLEKSTPSTYPSSLAPQITATAIVEPKRSDLAIETVTDDLVWTNDHQTVTQTLTAKFIDDGGAISPDNLNFGDTPIRIAVDNDQAVNLQNCSTEPLQLVRPTVPMPFVLTGQFPDTLDPAGRASFSIAFHPTELGPIEKTLSLMSMGGEQFEVTLRGNGVVDGGGSGSGSGDDGVLDETSFYACGCRSNGSPSGVLVIALAVLCALLPRRKRA
jgi:hypothetical protein